MSSHSFQRDGAHRLITTTASSFDMDEDDHIMSHGANTLTTDAIAESTTARSFLYPFVYKTFSINTEDLRVAGSSEGSSTPAESAANPHGSQKRRHLSSEAGPSHDPSPSSRPHLSATTSEQVATRVVRRLKTSNKTAVDQMMSVSVFNA